MKVVGLCGGSGVGKGYCSALFFECGIPAIDTDKVYHDLVSSGSDCLDELIAYFGKSIVSDSGALDRRELSRIVFSDKSALAELNRITHKHILAKTRDMIAEFEKTGYRAVLIDAPLLFESGFDKECDLILGVVADDAVRIARITKRDGITETAANKRISSQLTNDEIAKKCDYVIVNNGECDTLLDEIRALAEKILETEK